MLRSVRRGWMLGALLTVGVAKLVVATSAAHAGGPYDYYPVTPCRVVDTRNATGTDGGPQLTAGQTRNFAIRGNCGVPSTAAAVALNVTAVSPVFTSGNGWLALWPSGQSLPTVSTINFTTADGALANGAIVPLSTNADDLSVILGAATGSTVQVVLDVTGYFQ